MERKRIRADFYDYNDGVFFVTVVTDQHRHFFGKIENDCMVLSDIGRLLNNAITECSCHFPDVSIHIAQIMPNHFHAIIEVDRRRNTSTGADAACRVPTGCLRASNHDVEPGSFADRTHHNSRLAVAVGGIKSATTKAARKCCTSFTWQTRFNDHRIRNKVEYDMIYQYILDNPKRWNDDKLNIR